MQVQSLLVCLEAEDVLLLEQEEGTEKLWIKPAVPQPRGGGGSL